MNLNSIIENFLIIAIAIASINMGIGKETSTTLGPTFTKLKKDEGSYLASIQEKKATTEVYDISFFGSTKVNGIKKEDDASTNVLDFSKIKELQIEDPSYKSKRYESLPESVFIQATVTFNDDTTIKNFLIPRNVIICGIETGTKVQKSWFLHNLDKISVKKKTTKQMLEEMNKLRTKEIEEKETKENGLIKRTFKKIGKAIGGY